MAKQLDDNYDFGRSANYPWEQWLNGKPWEITKGEDFNTSWATFRSKLARAAINFNATVQTKKTGENTYVIQAKTNVGA